MSSKVERKLAAIMFTDIAGYTALSSTDENKALKLLDKQEEILTPIIEEFNGTLHNRIGDGLLFTFPTVTDAIKCGIKIQKETKEVEDLNLRIGIHEGEITLKNGDVLGDDVNVASRIDPFAAEGGIVISGKVQQNISSLPEFKTKFISEPLLKGVSQEVKVFCIISHGLPETNITKVTAKLEKDVKKLWHNQKFIICTIGLLVFTVLLFVGYENDFWQISPVIEKTFPDEIFFISNVRSNNEDLIILGDTLEVDGTTHLLSPISDEQIIMLNQEIISKTFPVLNNQFKYTTYSDIADQMAQEGRLPIEYDYRFQEKLKFSRSDADYHKSFIDSYVGSTNQFQIEADIHNAIYLNVYAIDPDVDGINKYVMLNSTYRIIGDIIGRDNEAVNYLDTIHTELYDIGILQLAGEPSTPIIISSLNDLPYQLSHSINSTIQDMINSHLIAGYEALQIRISAINNNRVVIEHNDKNNRLKINMHLSSYRLYHSDHNGEENFKTDLLNYQNAIKNNNSLMKNYIENENENGYTQTALDLILNNSHCISRPHCSFNYSLNTEIKIIEIFDNTAKGIIIKENNNPYIKIQVGDNLSFK